MEHESIQNILEQELSRRMRVNSRYSLRAFSKALGVSSGALSEILRNQRPVSLKAAAKMAKSLGMNAAEARHFLKLANADKQRELNGPTSLLTPTPLDEDTFRLIADWYHFAILNLLDCEGFKWQAAHVAKRLGLSLAQAKLAMDLLQRLGLVKISNGKASAQDQVLSPSGVPSTAVRSYHRQILGKAIEALELKPLDERDLNGVGFALDPKRLPLIKREISEFLDDLISKHSKGKRHEVYFLETALFQLSTGERDEKI